jgi:uncharacterized cysteine cluster protein YcgN (CxxCxxCC family)
MTNFWEKPLQELNATEWEALCDGCGLCCLHKLEDEVTDEVYYTDVACRYLDHNSCSCKDYANRLSNVPECTVLSMDNVNDFHWLPNTCAYRLRAEGKKLPKWHYLRCGNKELVHAADMSIQNKVISEEQVNPDDMEEHVVLWVE